MRCARIVGVLAAVVGLLTGLVGCGGNSSASSSPAAGSSATAGSSASSASGGVHRAGAIKIQITSQLTNEAVATPSSADGAEAAAAAINQAGGIKGHPIDVMPCDNKFDPNATAQCARDAVADKVVASVGAVIAFPTYTPILNSAGIPLIGGLGISSDEYTNPISFPLTAGIEGEDYAVMAQALQAGVKKFAYLSCPGAVCDYEASVFRRLLKEKGLPAPNVVTASLTLPDYTSPVAQLIEGGVNGVYVDGSPQRVEQVVQTLHEAGYTGKVFTGAAQVTPATISGLGSLANGIYINSLLAAPTVTSNPTVAQFQQQIKKQNSSATFDAYGEDAWTAVHLFAAVAKTIRGPITASSVLKAFRNLRAPVTLGTVPPYAVAGRTSPYPGAPRTFNPYVALYQIQGGALKETSNGFVNPAKLLGLPSS